MKTKRRLFVAAAVVLAFALAGCPNGSGDPILTPPVVTIGDMTGAFMEGVAGSVEVAVTGINLGGAGTVDFAATGVVTGLPAGVSASGTFTVDEDGSGSGVLTLAGAPERDGIIAVSVTIRTAPTVGFDLVVESLVPMIIVGPVPGYFTAGTVGMMLIPIRVVYVMALANHTVYFHPGNVSTPFGIVISGSINIDAAGMGEANLQLIAMTALWETGNHIVEVELGGVIGAFTLEVR